MREGAQMNCPKDQKALELIHFHSVPVQRCPACHGTWYEKDRLRILKDKEAHGEYCWINVDLWRDAAAFQASSPSRYACPVDGTPLTAVRYGNAKVVVDVCRKCEGIWLDQGEYAEILKFLDGTVNAQSTGDYLRDLRDEFREVLKGHPIAGLRGIEKILYLLELRFSVQHPELARTMQSLPPG